MNQILENRNDKKKKRNVAIVQFYFSICIFLLILVSFFINWFLSNQKQDYVSDMIDTYQISRLYANNEPVFPTFNSNGQVCTVIGIISIPKINVSYALAFFQLSTILSVFLGVNIFKERDLKNKIIGSLIMIFGAICIILYP